MTLDDVLKALRFDARLIEHNIANGTITRAEYEAFLKSLPDDSANAIHLKVEDIEDSEPSHH